MMREPAPETNDSSQANPSSDLRTELQDIVDKQAEAVKSDLLNASPDAVLGLSNDVDFQTALTQKLSSELQEDPTRTKVRQELLADRGVEVDAAAAAGVNLGDMTDTDWERVRNSPDQLMTLYAASQFRLEQNETTRIPIGGHRPRHTDPRAGREGLENEATIESLPLIHGLTAEAFERLVSSGTMRSNKSRYKESGADALAFHGAGIGATNFSDRELGLDQYVFFDFSRPATQHREQPEITLVVDPSAMEVPGTFMTKQDIADTTRTLNYASGITTPEYFKDTVLLRIANTVTDRVEERSGGPGSPYTSREVYNTVGGFLSGKDGDPDMHGNPTFSTYEVKVPDPPGVSLDMVRRVIVRDQSTYDRLVETLGDQFDLVYEPDLRPAGIKIENREQGPGGWLEDPGTYDVLQIPGAFEKNLEKIIEADYEKRVQQLDNLPDEDKEHVVAVLARTDASQINDPDIRKRIDIKTNPNRFSDRPIIYESEAVLRADVQSPPNRDVFGGQTASGRELWFEDYMSQQRRIRTTSGECVIATIERSRTHPTLARILATEPFSLEG